MSTTTAGFGGPVRSRPLRQQIISGEILHDESTGTLDPPEAWPADVDIALLVKKSSGLFVFASTVVKFIESKHHDPGECLQLIVSKLDDTNREGASRIDSL